MQARPELAAGDEMTARSRFTRAANRKMWGCERGSSHAERIQAPVCAWSLEFNQLDDAPNRQRDPLPEYHDCERSLGFDGSERRQDTMTMRNPRLYVDLPLAEGRRITLPEAAGHHATRVLRLGVGDGLTVFDGRGGEYGAAIARAVRGAVEVDIGAHEAVNRESAFAVALGQGICKGDRMDLVVQKATELGVQAIHPVACERTVVKLDPARAERRTAHWRAIAVHAAQQSGRTRVPEVSEVVDLDTWLARPGAGAGIVLSPRADASVCDFARPDPEKPVRLLVGPEGGLAPREVERARVAGFVGLRLGPRVLRTETAALVALGVLQARWGDLG